LKELAEKKDFDEKLEVDMKKIVEDFKSTIESEEKEGDDK
jgi:hypothetical protein